jgi:hypothetical protein
VLIHPCAARSRGPGGRGAFYKAKYGGRGGRGGNHHSGSEPAGEAPRNTGPRDWDQLQRDLKSIDGQQYGKHFSPFENILTPTPIIEVSFAMTYSATNV